MDRFLLVLIFALVACLASADRVNQTLETRLLEIESRLEKLEKIFQPGAVPNLYPHQTTLEGVKGLVK